MICVKMDTRCMYFEMEGHAGYAPVGQDIVCAAASALACTLIAHITAIVPTQDVLECERSIGKCVLHVYPPKRKLRHRCRIVYAAIREGLELLAEKYPENIRII